ncbi:UNKNOWN [Stylonychia lemnae]|uniref:Uncharacterized protein n=1 Tax=Stylonychia lemnae TaxID=5949 RepID=A0A077ZSX9_STYLE|nr:UNKNOWN [Stylonychia lemnae]|eukprot:CDW71576.1 UNKNOWN [Stylonychia lemnae]
MNDPNHLQVPNKASNKQENLNISPTVQSVDRSVLDMFKREGNQRRKSLSTKKIRKLQQQQQLQLNNLPNSTQNKSTINLQALLKSTNGSQTVRSQMETPGDAKLLRPKSNMSKGRNDGFKTDRYHKSNPTLQMLQSGSSFNKKKNDDLAQGTINLANINTVEDLQNADEQTVNIIHAIMLRKEKMKHSDFYTLLEQVTDRIQMYKSLFLDKKPKFIKDSMSHRVQSLELIDLKQKAAQDEKKQKLLEKLQEKKKKNAFYDNLSKKPLKKYKFQIQTGGDLNGNAIQNQNSKRLIQNHAQTENIYNSNGSHGHTLSNSDNNLSQMNQDSDNHQSNYLKEIARKEKLYSQKGRVQPQFRMPQQQQQFQTEVSVNGNNSLDSIHIQQLGSAERNKTSNSQEKEHLEINIRNDITYLQMLKNSSSLPYLKHIQVNDQQSPLRSYIDQKIKLIDHTEDDRKTSKRKLKILRLGEAKFKKLNQKNDLKKIIQEHNGILRNRELIPDDIIRKSHERSMSTSNLYKVQLKVLPVIESLQNLSKMPQFKEIIKSRRVGASFRDRYRDYNPIQSLFRSLRPRDDIQEQLIKSSRVVLKQQAQTEQQQNLDLLQTL